MIPQLTPISTSTIEAAVFAAAQQRGGLFDVATSSEVVLDIGHEVTGRRLRAVLSDLVERGSAVPLERGRYAIVDGLGRISPIAMGGFLAPAAYVSLWTAADHYRLTTQEVSTIAVVTATQKRPLDSEALGVRFIFHQTTGRRLFGWHEEPIDGVMACLADVEKVLIDLLWFGGQAGVPRAAQVMAIWEEGAKLMNPYVLVDYSNKMASSRLRRRVGYLMDLFGLTGSDGLLDWRSVDRSPVRLFASEAWNVERSAGRWGVYG